MNRTPREERPSLVGKWVNQSGILLIGYEMFRDMASGLYNEVDPNRYLNYLIGDNEFGKCKHTNALDVPCTCRAFEVIVGKPVPPSSLPLFIFIATNSHLLPG
jgi:hypothetical protein